MTKISELLHIDEDLKVERRPRYAKRSHDGSKVKDEPQPGPIVARFESCKQKEKVIKAARAIKPTNIMFSEDYSQRTLQRRRMQIPKLIDAGKRGKLAFFAMDKLIIKDKPPGRDAVNESK